MCNRLRDHQLDLNGTKIHLRGTQQNQWVTKDFSVVTRHLRASNLGLDNYKMTPLTLTITNHLNTNTKGVLT